MNILKYFKGMTFALAVSSSYVHATVITNGSFELGFSGWNTQDLIQPFGPLTVDASAPTDGLLGVSHGFDGSAGIIRVSQDITVTSASTILFDYSAAWTIFDPDTPPRTFDINIEVAGGGSNLAHFAIFTTANTLSGDTGPLTGSVDLSAFVGQTVNLNFDWLVAEDFTGPANFQLDNVRSIGTASVPEPSTLAILGLALMGLVSRKFKKRV